MRKCTANGKAAYFHRWGEVAYPIGSGLTAGSHPGGQVWETVAIVEYENGEVAKVMPELIKFTDAPEQGAPFDEPIPGMGEEVPCE